MKKFKGKLKLSVCLALALTFTPGMASSVYATAAQKLPVLLYHHMMPDEDYGGENPFVVRAEDFGKHMAWLYDHGYTTVTLEDVGRLLYDKKPLPKKSVMIQFDDGYYSNILYAYPILKQYGYTAVMFVITSFITDEKRDFLKPGSFVSVQAMEACADVFEFAGHTHNLHKEIDGKPALITAPEEAVIADLRESLDLLPNKTAFAYPYGRYSPEVIDILKEIGVDMAFTINKGYVQAGSDPYRLRRFTVYRDTMLDWIKKYIRDAAK